MYTFGVILGVLIVLTIFGAWKLLGKVLEWVITAIAFIVVGIQELIKLIRNRQI